MSGQNMKIPGYIKWILQCIKNLNGTLFAIKKLLTSFMNNFSFTFFCKIADEFISSFFPLQNRLAKFAFEIRVIEVVATVCMCQQILFMMMFISSFGTNE